MNQRLEVIEEEHAAVKESLIQRLTEKTATNKALMLDNRRLRHMVWNEREGERERGGEREGGRERERERETHRMTIISRY